MRFAEYPLQRDARHRALRLSPPDRSPDEAPSLGFLDRLQKDQIDGIRLQIDSLAVAFAWSDNTFADLLQACLLGVRPIIAGGLVDPVQRLAHRCVRKLRRQLRAAIHNRKVGKAAPDAETPTQLAVYAAFVHMTDPALGCAMFEALDGLDPAARSPED